MIIGARLEALMEARDLSQAELARRIGVSQPTIFRMLRDTKRGSAYLHQVARVLGTTPAYLVGETDDPDSHQPDSHFTSEEIEWLDLIRGIEPKVREAAITVIRALATSAPSPTIHSRQMSYRAPDDRRQLQAQPG